MKLKHFHAFFFLLVAISMGDMSVLSQTQAASLHPPLKVTSLSPQDPDTGWLNDRSEVKNLPRFSDPSDDPSDWPVDTNITYKPVLSQPRYVVPATNMPAGLKIFPNNNNGAIEFYNGRLFLAWRTAETHFASANALIHILSSDDMGQTWIWEWTVEIGSDVREPNFLSYLGELYFTFFQAGVNPVAFEPKHFWRIMRHSPGHWTGYMPGGEAGEVAWDEKVRNGVAWMTTYHGAHYGSVGFATLQLRFKRSYNGLDWEDVDPYNPAVYTGGVSEVGFEFDEKGDLWGVTRNEDGDQTGFGSHVVHAPANDLSKWEFPSQTDPECYESPKMFRHGKDLYLIGRKDIGGPFDQRMTWLPIESQRLINLVSYSLRPKRTALYKINTQTRQTEWLMDFPSAGDTCFPSVRRTGAHSFLIANYTSPVSHGDWSWLQGQISPEGTSIYLIELNFEPE